MNVRFRIVIEGVAPVPFINTVIGKALGATPENGGLSIQIGTAVDDEGSL